MGTKAHEDVTRFPTLFTCIRLLFSYNGVVGWSRLEGPNVEGDCGFFR